MEIINLVGFYSWRRRCDIIIILEWILHISVIFQDSACAMCTVDSGAHVNTPLNTYGT